VVLTGKNILVTGADGFIGSHLVETLLKRGLKVRALSQYNSFNNWGWLEDFYKEYDNLEIVSGDVRDPAYCNTITKDIDIIFHLAALIAIPYSYVAPSSYVDTNIIGTLNICQAALNNGCKKVMHTSTSEVYGTAISVPISETHPLQPQSPYSASKIGADAIASSFFNAFNLPLVIARPFNTYGPRQSNRAVIPTIISQIASGKKTVDLGDDKPTRDFNYVLDTVQGMIELVECDESVGQTVNIGSNQEISIGDLFNKIAKIMKSDAKMHLDDNRIRPEKSEVFRLWCDNSKISSLTGYKPAVGLDKGLELTCEWFMDPENLKKYKTEIYNV
jgi:NAD dependent epimerase/dehydratase